MELPINRIIGADPVLIPTFQKADSSGLILLALPTQSVSEIWVGQLMGWSAAETLEV